eukprot:2917134-Pyramimonas_sp.AAC.1
MHEMIKRGIPLPCSPMVAEPEPHASRASIGSMFGLRSERRSSSLSDSRRNTEWELETMASPSRASPLRPSLGAGPATPLPSTPPPHPSAQLSAAHWAVCFCFPGTLLLQR